jgi:hypothetical protein
MALMLLPVAGLPASTQRDPAVDARMSMVVVPPGLSAGSPPRRPLAT